MSFAGPSDPQKTCPNLNGHFVAHSFMVSVDFVIVQKNCDWIHVEGSGHALGMNYQESVDASLDGVNREFKSKYLENKERDFGSALFVGGILQGTVQRFVIDPNNGSTLRKDYLVSASMVDANTLKFEKYNIDTSGRKTKFRSYLAKRVP